MKAIARRYGVVPVILLLVMACDDGTAPIPDFDPAAPAAAMNEMMAASSDMAPAFSGLRAAGELFGETSFGAMLADGPAPTLSLAARTAAAGRIAADHREADGLATDDFAATVIPSEYLGTTFVWSEAEGAYVPSENTGAPANGVRILYYAVSPITGEPASPLNVLGHLDLVDESTDAYNRVLVEVVSTPAGAAPVTLGDYHVQSAFAFTQSSITVDVEAAGYLSNGTDQLDFSFVTDISITQSGMVATEDYEMSLEGTGTRVSYEATLETDPDMESGTFDVVVTLEHDGEEVVLDVALAADDTVEGEVRYQGVAVVHIAGTSENPSFSHPDGEALTSGEVAELEQLWQGVGSMFDLVAELLIFGD